MLISRLQKLLQKLHSALLLYHVTATPPPHKEEHCLQMGRWTAKCVHTPKATIHIVPSLTEPRPWQVLYSILDTDASKFAVGAILNQDYSNGRHPIRFFSKVLNPAECNYDIYNCELLAIIYMLKQFHYLLLEACHKFLIWTGHQNLKYFKSPQKITPHQAWWHEFLQDYNFELEHFSGKSNTIANLLSWRKDFEGGVNPNENVTFLPETLFACVTYLRNDPETQRQILHQIHNTSIRGYPRIKNMWNLIKCKYTGPGLCQFVKSYIKGCTMCQGSKIITYPKHTPLYCFDTHVKEGPFQYISMDLITNLLTSNKYDAILTIVDQGCSKATKFLPYRKIIDGITAASGGNKDCWII